MYLYEAKRYDIRVLSAETGEAVQQYFLNFGEVETLLVGLKEGDVLIVHSLGRQQDPLIHKDGH